MNAIQRGLPALFLGIGLLHSTPGAQTVPWSQGAAFFVSPTGSDSNPGTRALPFRTISFAAQTAGSGPGPATVNVLPGTYQGVAGTYPCAGQPSDECFPITLPAYGVAIEAHGSVTVLGVSTQPVFLVDSLGMTMSAGTPMPGSRIDGFTIAGGSEGVLIEPGPQIVPVTYRVEVRRCTLRDNALAGVEEVTGLLERAENVIEGNRIADNDGPGILLRSSTTANGQTFTLIRSNVIEGNPVGVRVDGPAGAFGLFQPRLYSNFLFHGRTNLDCDNALPWIINNTSAHSTDMAGSAPGGLGFVLTSTFEVMINNILWHENAPDIVGAGNLPIFSTHNYVEDVVNNPPAGTAPLPPPGFVVPDFAAPDLHLSPSSPLIGTASVTPFPTPLFIPGAVPPVRLDHGVDIDGDSRALDLNDDGVVGIEPGADEVASSRLTITNDDGLGNYLSLPFIPAAAITITGPPNAAATLLYWFGDTEDPVFANVLFPPSGNILLGMGMTILWTGAIPASGTLNLSLALNALGTAAEGQLYLQAILASAGPTVTGDLTNRVRVEIH